MFFCLDLFLASASLLRDWSDAGLIVSWVGVVAVAVVLVVVRHYLEVFASVLYESVCEAADSSVTIEQSATGREREKEREL